MELFVFHRTPAIFLPFIFLFLHFAFLDKVREIEEDVREVFLLDFSKVFF